MNFDEQVARIEVIAKRNLTGQNVFQTFDQDRVESLSEQELDGLWFGAIQLDANGKILKNNEYESKLAGISKVPAIGSSFSPKIAPCTHVKAFHGRFLAEVAKKALHAKFRYHFSFKKSPRDVSVTPRYVSPLAQSSLSLFRSEPEAVPLPVSGLRSVSVCKFLGKCLQSSMTRSANSSATLVCGKPSSTRFSSDNDQS